MNYKLLILLATGLLTACAQSPSDVDAEAADAFIAMDTYALLYGGTNIGELHVEQVNNVRKIRYKTDNNGRGSSSDEIVYLDDMGVPIDWQITGYTTFGNKFTEHFTIQNGVANWHAVAGQGQAEYSPGALYVAQNGSKMYSPYLYARAMLERNVKTSPALPAGTLSLNPIQKINLIRGSETLPTTLYGLTGISLDPEYLLLDDDKKLVAKLTPRFAMIPVTWQHEEKRLRKIVANLNSNRLNDIAKNATHRFSQPVRITNVHLFEPESLTMSGLKSVVIQGEKIVSVDKADVKGSSGEVLIDGKGGYLIPGLFEMHGHMQHQHALFNVLAGVTSVRDMGNEIDVIEPLIDDIENGELIGPRITKSAFIEGKSPFSSATGELASTQEEAVAAVKMYGERGGYHQIKIYNSIDGDWVPAMVTEAKKHGMRVTGHVPAFSKADEMIEAGYDEMTHINQVMLSWVLDRQEDTRTLFRITGMKRFTDLDLNAPQVQKTLNLMVENNVAIDPTMVIHEQGLLSRNGKVKPAMRGIVEHMPVSLQRNAKVAMLNIADKQEDEAYKRAFDKIIETLSVMHEKGILIVPGTDLGGAFNLHRELELFTKIGMTPAEALRRGSYDMANYLGDGDKLGSIEAGKLADFFLVEENPLHNLQALKTIPMVVKGGDVYFPSEVYPEFGITPFTTIPNIQSSF